MAIKISNNTIIDDSRNVINATSVGVGTTNPITQLDVIGNSYISSSIGIGTTAPTSELTVHGNVLVNDWDFSSLTLVGVATFTPNNLIDDLRGFTISPDEKYIYSTDSSEFIYQFILTPPGNIGVATTEFSQSTSSLDNYSDDDMEVTTGITFDLTGQNVYVVGTGSSQTIHQFPLSNPWDVTSINYEISVIRIGEELGLGASDDLKDLQFNNDGTKLFTAYENTINESYIIECTLNDSWNLSGFSTAIIREITQTSNGVDGFQFTSDGKHLLVGYGSSVTIFHYKVDPPWSIENLELVEQIPLVGVNTTFAFGQFALTSDGKNLYIGSTETAGSSTAPETAYKFEFSNNSNNKTEIVGQTDIYGTFNSHQTLNSYGLLKSTGSTQFSSINDGPLAGFRNAIINGGFDVWQRATSSTNTGNGYFTADRWWTGQGGGGTGRAVTYSRQGFDAGQTDVPGNPDWFFRWNETNNGGSGYTSKSIYYGIENAQNFAGETCTLSFYAKSNAGRTITARFDRQYGTGGSAYDSDIVTPQNVVLTTSWQKFTLTFSIPSVSGKTLSVAVETSALWLWFNLPNTGTFTFDLAKVQLEPGPVATEFERRPLGTELALCQRYYYKMTDGGGVGGPFAVGFTDGATTFFGSVHFPVTMRKSPSSLVTTGTASDYRVRSATSNTACTAVPTMSEPSPHGAYLEATTSGQTNGDAALLDSFATDSIIAFQAEI